MTKLRAYMIVNHPDNITYRIVDSPTQAFHWINVEANHQLTLPDDGGWNTFGLEVYNEGEWEEWEDEEGYNIDQYVAQDYNPETLLTQ